MKTYRVVAQYISYVYTNIEAKDYEEAQELARYLDGSSFEDAGYGDWDIYSIDEFDEIQEQTA